MNTGRLPRTLGLVDAVSIAVGIIVGGGIFLVPGLVAHSVGSATGVYTVWIAGGVLSFLGALAFAELGAMMPETGGQYVFLREAYGPMAGFLCGWTSFLTSQSAAIAWLGVSFAIYLRYFVPVGTGAGRAIGIALIGLVAAANYRGVRLGAGVQKTFTLAKVAGIAVLVGSAFFARPAGVAGAGVPLTISAFGAGLIATLMSYDGWATVGHVAGEIRDPQRNVHRALAIGVALCILIYVTANFAYLRVFGVAGMSGNDRIGAALAERTMGAAGGSLLALVILISIVGSVNGWLLTQPRVYFAQARDGLFFERFGEIHPRYQTPGFSIVMQFLWSSILILTGSFELLIGFAMFAIWIFYGLTVAGVMVLRWKRPELPRPYRMWGYPVTPALFVLIAAWFVVNTAVESPGPSLTALGLILAGVPVYWIWNRRRAERGEAAGA